MSIDVWNGPIEAKGIQMGDIFDITVILPCKIDGLRRQVRVLGAGSELIRATVELLGTPPD